MSNITINVYAGPGYERIHKKGGIYHVKENSDICLIIDAGRNWIFASVYSTREYSYDYEYKGEKLRIDNFLHETETIKASTESNWIKKDSLGNKKGYIKIKILLSDYIIMDGKILNSKEEHVPDFKKESFEVCGYEDKGIKRFFPKDRCEFYDPENVTKIETTLIFQII